MRKSPAVVKIICRCRFQPRRTAHRPLDQRPHRGLGAVQIHQVEAGQELLRRRSSIDDAHIPLADFLMIAQCLIRTPPAEIPLDCVPRHIVRKESEWTALNE